MSASSLPLPQGKSVSLKQFVSRHINEIGLLVVIAILYLVFSLNAPGFISLNNQMNVLRDAATIGIAAWAMTLIIISGEIDVSVGRWWLLFQCAWRFCCNLKFRWRLLVCWCCC